MKIDMVLTAGNLNHHYLQLFPLIHLVWKKRFNLDCFMVFVGNELPEYLKKLQDFIIIFKPLEGINDIFVAQVIRLLYPIMFPDKTVLITDLDIIPVKKSYFIHPIINFDEDSFVTYTNRYHKQKMYAICYNLAKGKIYGDLFNFKEDERNIQGIINKLKEWYHPEYTGVKNCPGWYTDQKKLYEYFQNYNGFKEILKDEEINFKRLNNRAKDKEYIIKNFNQIYKELESYSDIHCIKPYSRTKKILIKFVKKLIYN